MSVHLRQNIKEIIKTRRVIFHSSNESPWRFTVWLRAPRREKSPLLESDSSAIQRSHGSNWGDKGYGR